MTEVDVVDHLTSDHEDDEAEKDDGATSVGEVLEVVVSSVADISEGKNLEFRQATAASGINREEHWPTDEASDDADNYAYLQEAEEEVAVQRVVVEDVLFVH